jgi:hypothetical protein
MVKRRIRSTAFHVSSKVPTGRRMELLRQFRESPSAVITNARCLTEGVDVPSVDAVLFADPRRSTVDIVQAVGRALRKSRDKPAKIGYVLLPVLVEDGQTVEEFLESSAFKEVGRVLAVLSTHDERIAEEFRAKDAGGKRPAREQRVIFSGDVPVGVRLSAEAFAERCGARVWQRVAKVNWRSFEEARRFALSLGLRGQKEWIKFCAGMLSDRGVRPLDIPSNPQLTYRQLGWTNWADWLGNAVAPRYRLKRSFCDARKFARRLGLTKRSDWNRWCRGLISGKPPKPFDIPSAPQVAYAKSGWNGWGDWLGTGNVAFHLRHYLPFPAARSFARSLGLVDHAAWRDYVRGRLSGKPPLPTNIPADPYSKYRSKGWRNWRDWLGPRVAKHPSWKYRAFHDAREFARGFGFRGQQDWIAYCAGRLAGLPAKPSDVPTHPERIYGDLGWRGIRDWLGTDRKPRKPRKKPS